MFRISSGSFKGSDEFFILFLLLLPPAPKGEHQPAPLIPQKIFGPIGMKLDNLLDPSDGAKGTVGALMLPLRGWGQCRQKVYTTYYSDFKICQRTKIIYHGTKNLLFFISSYCDYQYS